MRTISAGVLECYCDALVIGAQNEPIFVSFFDRSAQAVRALGAALVLEGKVSFQGRGYVNDSLFDVIYSQIVRGKEKFTHGIALAKGVKDKYLITTEERMEEDLYNFLMQTQDLPLLREWMHEIKDALFRHGILYVTVNNRMYGNTEHWIRIDGEEKVRLQDLKFYTSLITEEKLKGIISDLLRKKRIRIAEAEQKPLLLNNMDDYFKNYGPSIVKNLERQLHPVAGLNGEIDSIALSRTRPYPQQAAMINGVYEYFRKRKRGSVFFIMGMGSGKTLQASAEAEMLYVRRWLEAHPDKTLADAYAGDGVIHYRHVVMCPGQLVEKWKKSILADIPYAKPVIINDFKQLVALREAGKERRFGKEFYIISKDFAKLSYQMIPTPKKEGIRKVELFYCNNCSATIPRKTEECPFCGSRDIAIRKTRFLRKGMICPNCNRLLYKKNMRFDIEALEDPEDTSSDPLQWTDFVYETNQNTNCLYCEEPLWTPFVRNINTEFGKASKKPAWIRQTFWANQARKGKKTYWILQGKQSEARRIWGAPINEIEAEGGCRKYSPAQFIKRYMKGYFDVFIADEIHKAKGGSTAQGSAFHAIKKSSRYVLALTGSLTGGMASDLFYLMYRMFPEKMVRHGYQYGDILRFSKEYGCVEQDFSPVQDIRRNTFSRGRQLSNIRTLPGISPIIFSEFLLDVAVFLDIEDMSANMPPHYEKIILVNPKPGSAEEEVQRQYRSAIATIKDYERRALVNLSSVRHQFSMSYLDKPYGVSPILDPRDGSIVVEPGNYASVFTGENRELLEKETALCKTIKQELSEGRNCIVYAEYTNSDETNVLPRLRELILSKCGLQQREVVIMKASFPSAARREAWMQEKAEEGMKIMLCNPRLCETGLDFCWEYKGKTYNYPTLMFYQCGYSLFVTWQAAGRSWRLNQKEECRTYYFAYAGTVQQAILQVLGEKKSAASAIQGRFSADGLAAMAKGVDTQVRIAQIMNEMDATSGDRLKEMFDVIADSKEDGTFGQCKRMKLLSEIIAIAKEKRDLFTGNENLFANMFTDLLGGTEEDGGGIGDLNQLLGFSLFGSDSSDTLMKPKRKVKKTGKTELLFEPLI